MTTWRELDAGDDEHVGVFDPDTLEGLPVPAQRLLSAALPTGAPLDRVARLQMTGEIKLGSWWLRFTARQILWAGVGFVWAPVVGGRIIRFVGADALGPDTARLEFRFHDLFPVVRATGPDVARSAAGRLAAETVAWLPQQLTPQAGARWEPIDDRCAAVTLDAAGRDVRVEVAVDPVGRLEWVGIQRWKDSAKPPAEVPFGGSMHSVFRHSSGVGIAGSGTVGWEWHTPDQADGEFFRYRITDVSFGVAPETNAQLSSPQG